MSNKDINTYSILLSEALFMLFPFVVIFIVLFHKGDVVSIFHYPDWALAASVLNGQAVIKIVSGTIAGDNKSQWQRVSLLVTALIIIGFVPPLIILSLILVSETPSTFLVISQMVLFFMSFIIFFWVGKTGHDLGDRSETRSS